MPETIRPVAAHQPPPTYTPACPRCAQPLIPVLSLLPMHRFGEVSNTTHARARPRLGPTRRSSRNPTAECAGVLIRGESRRRVLLT